MHVWIVVLVGPVLRCSYALARGYSLCTAGLGSYTVGICPVLTCVSGETNAFLAALRTYILGLLSSCHSTKQKYSSDEGLQDFPGRSIR